MSEFDIRIDKNQVNNLLRKLDNIAQDNVISKGLSDGGHYIERFIKQNKLSGPRPELLGVVSGKLRASITTSEVEKQGTNYSVRVGTSVDDIPYARIHEFGGWIHQGARSALYVQNRYKGSGKVHTKGQFKKGYTRGHGYTYLSRSIHIPARSYIRSTAEDLRVIKKVIDIFMNIIKRALR
jgi:phage gpG-like protein